MISFKTWNTNFFDGIFPNINNIKKDVLKKEYLSLPFLEGSNGLEIGTLNVFCGHGDSGFSVFVNTLAHEVSSKQNVSTVLISDIILKSFITQGLNKSGAQVSKTLFTVLQDFKITKKCDFFQKLDELVQSHNLQLLLVYPFLIPQEDIDDVLGLLKRFAQKNKITIVMNIPEEKILLDYNRINITEIDSVLKTTAPVIIHNLNNHFRSFKLEVECMKTNAKRSYQVILNEKKQLIQSYRHSDVVVA